MMRDERGGYIQMHVAISQQVNLNLKCAQNIEKNDVMGQVIQGRGSSIIGTSITVILAIPGFIKNSN